MAKTKRVIVKSVFVVADNIISPLGKTTAENFEAVRAGISGIKLINNTSLLPEPFYAAMVDETTASGYLTRFEAICVESIADALHQVNISLADENTLFILSSTKGNIALIEESKNDTNTTEHVSLHSTARRIAAHFGAVNNPLVISNACISGVLAIIIGRRLLNAGKYDHIVITGADVLSKFVLSGFHALGAMSKGICKPFDAARDGINLGECAATVVLSTDKRLYTDGMIKVLGGASSNDANHISGPSRTGAELTHAITAAIKESGITAEDLSFISAHGTATVFNDEMEAKAFKLAGLQEVPIHSLKPHFGHTLGAAGVVESVITFCGLKEQVVLPSRNFQTLGVSESINVSISLTKSAKHNALKTASGFGGCNAAVVFGV